MNSLISIAALLTAIALLFTVKRAFRLQATSLPIIMMSVWVFFIGASLLFLRGYEWHYSGLLWIIMSCLVVSFGFVFGVRLMNKMPSNVLKREKTQVNTKKLKRILVVSIILGMVYGAIKVQNFGVSLADILSLSDLGEVNNQIAVARYSGTGAYSIFVQFLLSFVYLSALLGGLLFSAAETKRDKVLALLSFLPELFMFSFSNEKATLLICIFLWLSSYIVSYIRVYGKYPKISLKQIVTGVALIAGIMALLITSMMLRIGEVNATNFDIAMQKIGNSYAFSHVAAFDNYYSQERTSSRSFGTVTFYGLSNFIGINKRSQGIYNDSFESGNIGTNVFTPFRGLIDDFGVVGALLFQFIIALLAGICAHKVKYSTTNPYLSTVFLLGSYSFVLYFVASIFSYLSIIIAFIFLSVILAFHPLIIRPIKREERSYAA